MAKSKAKSRRDRRSPGPREAEIGALVRKHRLSAGASQQELAAKLGITFQQVQKYEMGVNRVAVSRLMDIAKALDREITDFIPD